MRRVLVIFLILLFPLNVFALSMSAASPWQHGDAKAQPHAALADAGQDEGAADDSCSGNGGCNVDLDIDPDEPPSAGDLHYIFGDGASLQFTCLPSRAVPLHDAAPYCHALPPPVKPPRTA